MMRVADRYIGSPTSVAIMALRHPPIRRQSEGAGGKEAPVNKFPNQYITNGDIKKKLDPP